MFLFVDRRKLYGVSVSRRQVRSMPPRRYSGAEMELHTALPIHVVPRHAIWWCVPPKKKTTTSEETTQTTHRHHVNGNLVPIFDLQRFFHLHHVRVFAQFQSFRAVSRQFQRPAFFLFIFDFAREYRHHLAGFLRLPVERFPRSKRSRDGVGGFVQDVVRQLRTGLEERSDRSKVRTHFFFLSETDDDDDDVTTALAG